MESYEFQEVLLDMKKSLRGSRRSEEVQKGSGAPEPGGEGAGGGPMGSKVGPRDSFLILESP